MCSPPLREPDDQAALWAGLADQCPFTFATQKMVERDNFTLIPNGVPGIKERMMLHGAGVGGGHISLERFVDLTATTPARLFGLGGGQGSIAVGHDADIVLWDQGQERTFTAATNHSAIDYRLYEGRTVTGAPVLTLARGEIVTEGGPLKARHGSGIALSRACIG